MKGSIRMLFGLLSAVMASTRPSTQKQAMAKELNRKSGGMLFISSPYGPSKLLNQRQKRKRIRQQPHGR